MTFDPLERFFSSMAIFLLFICSLLYISRGFKRDDKNERILMFGFGVFLFKIALTRLFFYIIDYFLIGTYTGNLNIIIQSYDVVNYIFLYFYLYLYIQIFISTIVIMTIFIWSSFKSKHEFQAISSVIAIGFAIFLIGWSFEAFIIKDLSIITPAIPPIFIIMGVLITISPLIGYIEFFSKRIVKVFILIMISLLAIYIGLTLIFNIQLVDLVLIIIWIAVFTLILTIGYIFYNYVKRRESGKYKEELQDTLRIFTKPPKFDIQEIKYSREKELCLVCKNKISGLTYVCPKCGAWYCLDCCEALTELENACWGCETPFDKFKSVKYMNKNY